MQSSQYIQLDLLRDVDAHNGIWAGEVLHTLLIHPGVPHGEQE
jgi:hypothetical protein